MSNSNTKESEEVNVDDLPNPNEILTYVTMIKKDMKNMKTKDLDIKYQDFKNKYTNIYKSIIKNEDLSTLFDMLKLLQQVKTKNVSLDNANKYIGETMANRYIPEHILKDKKKK